MSDMEDFIVTCVSFFILGIATTFSFFEARAYRKERESLAYWDKQRYELWAMVAMVAKSAPVDNPDAGR